MCGITGICNSRINPVEAIKKMNDRIIHRGPDADGVWYDDNLCVALGHRRLSILDLSENGSQPMVSEGQDYVLVYNGEIYNYRQLKEQLCQKYPEVTFKGTSDTEYLLRSIELLGIEETLRNIKGMFAFACLDRKKKCIYLARDRMGEKPLYYGMVGESFVFASDLASIEEVEGFQGKINETVLDSYLHNGYITAPDTIYENIWKLEQGHFLTVYAPFSKWEDTEYWSIKKVAKYGQEHMFSGNFEDASLLLEEKIKDSVRGQMISDVPLGAFLSGGIDSTLTVSLMQSMSDIPVRTFTIGFEEEGYNEAEFAKETAKHLGTKHTEMYVGKKDVLEVLHQIPKAFSEPFADSSQIPTMLVSKMTKQHVTVSLSGDAGDEFYCGYNTYKDVQDGLQVVKGKLGFVKDPIRSAVGNLCYGMGKKGNAKLYKVGNVFSIKTEEDFYRAMARNDLRVGLLPLQKKQTKDKLYDYEHGYLKGVEPNLMLMDMMQYLPDDILVKVDRAGMLYSLESRIPLLDRDVMEFAWTLPHEYKFKDGVTKRILKDILYRYVPKEFMDRPKKGFSIPVEQWLRTGILTEWANDLMKDTRGLLGKYLDLKVLDSLWEEFQKTGNNKKTIWHILMLAQWLQEKKRK